MYAFDGLGILGNNRSKSVLLLGSNRASKEELFFIQSIDSRQRFVQIRFILKPKAWTKLDRRYTVNFFVQVNDEKDSKIRLQINREVLQSTGRANDNWSYYYRDEGMLKADDKLYDELIIELKHYYDSL